MKYYKVARQLEIEDIVMIDGEFRPVAMRAHKEGDKFVAVWFTSDPHKIRPVHMFRADELVEVQKND